MKPFETWWNEVLQALDQPRTIRNWTAREGFAIGRSFVARTYRSLPPGIQQQVTWATPNHPNDLIICTPIEGGAWKGVGKPSFQQRYWKWRDYRNDGMTRLAFGGNSPATPYLIALFKEFNHLIDA